MEAALLWLLRSDSAEALLIYNLVHLLLAGLVLLVYVHRLRATESEKTPLHLFSLGFFVLVLHFAVRTAYFGAGLFFRADLHTAVLDRVGHALLSCGAIIVSAALAWSESRRSSRPWALWACCGVVVLTAAVDAVAFANWPRSPATLLIDVIGIAALANALRMVLKSARRPWNSQLLALGSFGFALILHGIVPLVQGRAEVILGNLEQAVLVASLGAFAWAAAEDSQNMVDRVFVRLNLVFVILATLILLITTAMEKSQYARQAEERSAGVADFLQTQITGYRSSGESLQEAVRHPDVVNRLLVGFGSLPELRQIDIYADGQRVSFRYSDNLEIESEVLPHSGLSSNANAIPNKTFPMIRRALGRDERIEFFGTTDYISRYIGNFIIFVYAVFTVMVALATGIIGIIVTDTDRQLRRKYEELQRSQEQLAQAAKLASIGELAGGMAHEINTPITSILSLSSHLAADSNPSSFTPRQRRSLQLIAEQAERVAGTVGGLLSFSRQSPLHFDRVDVRNVLETALALVSYRLNGTIHLRRDIATNLPTVQADAGRLTEVVVNLLNNAVDAMPGGGTLVLRASTIDGAKPGLRLEVTDTGVGIPAEHVPLIFDPFFTTKQPGRGTGLGLSISHGIVKKHGGEIWAQSQPGEGTTFVMTLPTEVHHEATHPGR